MGFFSSLSQAKHKGGDEGLGIIKVLAGQNANFGETVLHVKDFMSVWLKPQVPGLDLSAMQSNALF